MVKKFKIAPRILPELYQDLLEENDLVVVILEHIDYLLKMKGKKSPYAQAAFSISKLKKPLSTMRKKLRHIKGVGIVTEKIISEILDTGGSAYFRSLLNDYL
jgi:DNA polymerase/3'-5' exonuclease PolX